MVSLQQIHGVKPISTCYSSGSYSKKINVHSSAANFMDEVNYKNLLATSIPKEEAKLMSALKHKEAERKRRVRINGQFAELRTVLPNLIKRKKASVLAETIKCLKDLVNTLSELKEIYGVGRLSSVFSGGTDMLRVEYSPGQGLKLVKVMLSCEDKRKLMFDIARAVRSVKGKLVKAEISIMCGWTECVLWVQGINSYQQLQILKTALGAVIEPKRPNNKPQLCW
eukprot:XP_025015163.1 transcription factor bHLH131 [Ricinus communis]